MRAAEKKCKYTYNVLYMPPFSLDEALACQGKVARFATVTVDQLTGLHSVAGGIARTILDSAAQENLSVDQWCQEIRGYVTDLSQSDIEVRYTVASRTRSCELQPGLACRVSNIQCCVFTGGWAPWWWCIKFQMHISCLH